MPVVTASHGNQVCSGWLNEITRWAKGQAADLTDACKASDLRLRGVAMRELEGNQITSPADCIKRLGSPGPLLAGRNKPRGHFLATVTRMGTWEKTGAEAGTSWGPDFCSLVRSKEQLGQVHVGRRPRGSVP